MYHLSEAYAMATFICLLCGYLGALIFAATATPRFAVKHLDRARFAPLTVPALAQCTSSSR